MVKSISLKYVACLRFRIEIFGMIESNGKVFGLNLGHCKGLKHGKVCDILVTHNQCIRKQEFSARPQILMS